MADRMQGAPVQNGGRWRVSLNRQPQNGCRIGVRHDGIKGLRHPGVDPGSIVRRHGRQRQRHSWRGIRLSCPATGGGRWRVIQGRHRHNGCRIGVRHDGVKGLCRPGLDPGSIVRGHGRQRQRHPGRGIRLFYTATGDERWRVILEHRPHNGCRIGVRHDGVKGLCRPGLDPGAIVRGHGRKKSHRPERVASA